MRKLLKCVQPVLEQLGAGIPGLLRMELGALQRPVLHQATKCTMLGATSGGFGLAASAAAGSDCTA